MKKLAASVLAAAAGLVVATGCGSPSSTSSPATQASTVQLRGTYTPTSAGAIAQLTFLDATRDEIGWTSCSGGGPCTRAGTYTVNPEATELTLTDAVSGTVTTMSFTALKSESTQSLEVLDLVTAADAGLVGATPDGGLVGATPDGGLVSGGAPLVTQFSAQPSGDAPQTFENDPTEPQANQANTPESPYDCSGGVCMYDDSSFWGQSYEPKSDLFAQ